MIFTADTNVLVRAIVGDDPRQSPIARETLSKAEMVVIPMSVICELLWVLAGIYGYGRAALASVVRRLLATGNMRLDDRAAQAGLEMLEAGGDFADGAIAQEGRQLGASLFLSFDVKAVRLVRKLGNQAAIPGEDTSP